MIRISGKAPKPFEKACAQTFDSLSLSGEALVEVTFVSKEDIQEINKEMRAIDKVTDVLSFPMLDEITTFNKENYPYDYDGEESAVRIGSIVICNDVAKQQAEEYGHSVVREKTYLFVHGLLHLLGYDHIEEDDKKKMRAAEETILSAIGITR